MSTPSPVAAAPVRRLPLLGLYLREHRELTAVEQFARDHDHGTVPAQGTYYRDLIPAALPGQGEQYAFAVDLDRCTACKACVSACHSLNGLDDDETWRSVGLLHGGSPEKPVQQTVTTACHHCLEPACMAGCPVQAYEKDSITGIVRHLDDQCIGCQYCVFTCPYEVPKFNAKLGIVRKCDMCSDRLKAGEAPACVQACPNGAISIAIVSNTKVIEDAQSDAFLPGAPSPGITVPTTLYKTERPLPRNMLPANFFVVSPSHHHIPLVMMLVLTQLSVGAFGVDVLAGRLFDSAGLAVVRPYHALVALMAGLTALVASIFHLGRPQYAFRAILGLRTSWMSREILAFGLFAPAAAVYAAAPWQALIATQLGWHSIPPEVMERWTRGLGDAVFVTGCIGIACSVLIYHVTRRAWWDAPRTGLKFAMTAVILGVSMTAAVLSVAQVASDDWAMREEFGDRIRAMDGLIAAATALKLLVELALFRHLQSKQQTALKRTAILMRHDLGAYVAARFAAGVVGAGLAAGGATGTFTPAAGVGMALALFVVLLVGELLERTLFFAAMSSTGMPGGLK